jgi:hypothetical protein
VLASVRVLAELPGVPEAVAMARAACEPLTRHSGFKSVEGREAARAEVAARAARSNAALDGAVLPLDLVRQAVAGGPARLGSDPVGLTVAGALRAHGETERLAETWRRAPRQALARLHLAAAAGLVPDDALGRPRPDAAQRLAVIADLMTTDEAPALVIAGLVHAELVTGEPFGPGSGVVARAAARLLLVGRGLDPTGLALWEAGHLAAGPGYRGALEAYDSGAPEGVVLWLRHCSDAVVYGVGESRTMLR